MENRIIQTTSFVIFEDILIKVIKKTFKLKFFEHKHNAI